MTGGYDQIGKAICGLIGLLFLILPLGIWKAIEIIIWIFNHVHFGDAK